MLDEFLFADDLAKEAPTEEKMQKGVDQVSDSCDSYDLTISIKKTEASTWKALQGAYHHSERSTTASGRQVSSTLEEHCLELCTLMMMKSMLELPKLVQHLSGYMEVFGTEVESDLTQS